MVLGYNFFGYYTEQTLATTMKQTEIFGPF